jgi:hypothetical protein
VILVKIAVCSGSGSREISDRIAGNLRRKGHATQVVTEGLHAYLDAISESDAMLIVNDTGKVSPEMVVAMVLADYLGKRIMATKEPENQALRVLLESLKIEVVD